MKRQLFRRFLMLLSGTTAAQLLPVVTAPVIARHYEAAEFGVFGLYIAASAICTTVANLKYENVILSTRSRSVTQAVLGLSLLVNLVIGVLIVVGIAGAMSMGLLAPTPIAGDLIVFLPLSLLLGGGLQALSNVALQQELFSAVARSRITAAAVTAAASLLCALFHPTARALILASLAGQLLAASLLAWLCLKGRGVRPAWQPRRWHAVARRHWRFALFTSPADLLNSSASNLPALFLGAQFGTAATGAYVLTQRLLGTPLMVIGSAFADLYRQSVGRRSATGQPYWDVSWRMLMVLSIFGLLALTAALLAGRSIATAFLGDHWQLVGEFAVILVWFYVTRFIVSPLTFSFYVAKRHAEDLLLQTVSALTVIGLCLITKSSQIALMDFLISLTTALTAVYLVYGLRSLQFAHKSIHQLPITVRVDPQ